MRYVYLFITHLSVGFADDSSCINSIRGFILPLKLFNDLQTIAIFLPRPGIPWIPTDSAFSSIQIVLDSKSCLIK